MERVRRLTSLWNWLPAFRAVAETEHLPAASKQLHVSPSALSRTIRLIEEDVGQPLFNRVGRSIELNATGERLLSAVRDSMRLIDEALGAMAAKQFVGAVKVSSFEPFTARYVVPALTRLSTVHPELLPSVTTQPSALHNAMLLRGEIDVALSIDPRAHEQVSMQKLADLEMGLYVGLDHPLHQTSPSLDELLEHKFVAPDDDDGISRDGWPAHQRRTVGMHAEFGVALDVVKRGAMVGALPVILTNAEPDLFRLDLPVVTPIAIYALIRKSLGFEGRAEVVVGAIEDALSA